MVLLISSSILPETARAVLSPSSLTAGSPPPNGAPWDNVLNVNGASGVYLGNGWVLTAAHVGFDPIVEIRGESFTSSDPGKRFSFTNVDGIGTPDLLLYLLDSTPADDSLMRLSLGGVDSGDAFTMIGYGGGTKQWGLNSVEGMEFSLNAGGFRTEANYSFYDADTPNEGKLVGGDSGGAIFVERNNEWELGGIMLAHSYSGSTFFYADLHAYADQIQYKMDREGLMKSPEPGTALLGCLMATLFLLRRKRA